MTSGTWIRRAGSVAATATTVAALAVVTSRGDAAPPTGSGWLSGPGSAATVAAEAPAGDVTLVTGDVVHVAHAGGGKSAVTVTPAPRPDGSRPSFWVTQQGQDLTVLPNDVAALTPTRLDPALFDVTSLLQQGDGDAQSSAIPLIVTYAGTPRAVPGTTVARRLNSVHGTAVRADKASAARLGGALVTLAKAPTNTATSLAGVRKIWLDARVKVTLDGNLSQIGAPQAWAQGASGAGVTVAVLDTGVDASHPDLAGAVAASQNFTTAEDATDHFGHGTHVASIIAGRGTASGGERKGVAYGATLLNGKVLDDDGYGYASWAIAGMEWASTTEHADIVNMSLGFPPGSSQGSPVTTAVDQLTAADNTLFVIASGNSGCDTCVSSPGDAASALTVGAVDGQDRLAPFSSRGPVAGTYAVKPDITAPGVDIVAARAAGTSLGTPVGDSYTTLSGTSMATPHVAGAAALLLQERGAMPAQDLKAALMGTAEPTAGVPVYSQGAGRLDVARAVASPVLGTPGVVNFGKFQWPYPARPTSRTISYRNGADHAVMLDLSTDLSAVTVSPAQLTVPAGGTASADVALDLNLGGTGLSGGTVTARADDGTTLHTTLGYFKEPEMHTLRVNGIARDGRAAVGGFRVMDVHDGSVAATRYWPGDASVPCTSAAWAQSNCVRVPPGTYSVMGFVFTMPADKPSTVQDRTALNTSLVGNPEVTIDKDTTLTLDARDAKEVTVATPGHAARANMGGAAELAVHRAPQDGPGLTDEIVNFPGAQLEERFFMQPTPQVTLGDFSAYTRWRLEAPDITLAVAGHPGVPLAPSYYDPVWFSDVSAQYPRLDGTAQLRLVDAGTAADLAGRDLHGAIALVRRSDAIAVAEQANDAAAAGARLVAIYNDGPGVNGDPGGAGVQLQVPTVRLSHDEGLALLRLLAAGPVIVAARGVADSPYQYDLVYPEHGSISQNLHYVADISQLASVERHFHGELDNAMSYGEAAYQFQPSDAYSVTTFYPLTGAPRTRTDYHIGDPDVRWAYGVQTPEPPYNYLWPEPDAARMALNTPAMTTYRPGERSADQWFAGPIAPGIDPLQPLRRTGNVMRVHMAGFVDAAGNFSDAYTSMFEHGLTTEFRMFAGEQQIAETRFLPAGTIAVPAADTAYRIDYQVDNAAPWAALSTHTSSQWTFRSQQPASGQVVTEPLLTADYDVDLDLHNRLATLGPATIGVDVGHQAGAAAAPVTDVSLDISYDDGGSWHALDLRRMGAGRYVGSLDRNAPAHTSGLVSLRLHAADGAGSTLQQEIVRAFAVTPR